MKTYKSETCEGDPLESKVMARSKYRIGEEEKLDNGEMGRELVMRIFEQGGRAVKSSKQRDYSGYFYLKEGKLYFSRFRHREDPKIKNLDFAVYESIKR